MVKSLLDSSINYKDSKEVDDNDLDLARRTVIDIDAFCRLLVLETNRRNNEENKKDEGGDVTPFDVLMTELM